MENSNSGSADISEDSFPEDPLQVKTSPLAPAKDPHISFMVMVLFVSLIISTLAIFLFWQNQQLRAQLVKYQSSTPAPSASPVASPDSVDPNSGWQTYTNKAYKYSIKYPSGWIIDSSQAEEGPDTELGASLSISRNGYKLTILWPTVFGPGMCIFDDQSRQKAPDMASYCEGKFVDFGKARRRLEKPQVVGDRAQWSIYTLEDENYVTVPPTNYEAPLKYTEDEISVMDQILASYQAD